MSASSAPKVGCRARHLAAGLAVVTALAVPLATQPAAAVAGAPAPRSGATADAIAATRAAGTAGTATSVRLWDGRRVTLGADGIGSVTSANGRSTLPLAIASPRGHTAFGDLHGPTANELAARFATAHRGPAVPGEIVVALDSGTLGSAAASAAPTGSAPQLTAALRAVHATGVRRALPSIATASRLTTSARSTLGTGAVDLSRVYLVTVSGDAQAAARRLAAVPGVREASPNFYLSPLATEPQPLPDWVTRVAGPAAGTAASNSAAAPDPDAASGVPSNYGLQASLQSYLNAGGVDAVGAFADLHQRFGQLPGAGERITNVSLGDLTDAAMAKHDPYVQQFGPTTIVKGGQRYLDVPSMPLIPTYVAAPDGSLDPRGSVEHVDPFLGEVLLDFSVMAPLPHGMQRPSERGSGATDLLGIAPGADYRLVVPQQPTFAGIGTALLAAATQTPRPDVITASLGYGFDGVGFPGRYLEDDPILRTIVAGIVQGDGVVVCISSNDGTRLFTPAAIGPDGGSAATNLPDGQPPTSVADDGYTTIPSLVPDSGAIAVGGSTTDDTLAAPPAAGGPLAGDGAFPETRTDGGTYFSSGFGTRIDVSAPSDNIPALQHGCTSTCAADSVVPVLEGGTSASAPMVAAAAAVILQAGRLTGQALTPAQVRAVLHDTGRALPNPPQIEAQLQVGPQLDVTAAVEHVLGSASGSAPTGVRLSVAQRQELGNLGAAFVEATDPGDIDLSGPPNFDGTPTGQNSVSPITFGLDTSGPAPAGASYELRVGAHGVLPSAVPYLRVLPAQLLAAAGSSSRAGSPVDVPVRFVELVDGTVVAGAGETLHVLPWAGDHIESLPPAVAPVQRLGSAVRVHYDLRQLMNVYQPHLVVSSVGHWSPAAAPLFRAQWSVPLTASSGTVSVPASVFAPGGAGLYGVGIAFGTDNPTYGEFASFRVAAPVAVRPPAPTIAVGAGPFGHEATVTRTAPTLLLRYDVRGVPGADGVAVEFSSPGPALYGQWNTFTNGFGSKRDDNGGDTPSSAWFTAPNPSGTLTLDAQKLGLQSSLLYTVRVLATAAGRPVGEASPVSFLAYDDSATPGAAQIVDFDVRPGATSTVATAAIDAAGNLGGTAVTRFDPATGRYGPKLVGSGTGARFFRIIGSDPALGRVVVLDEDSTGFAQKLDVIDTATGQRVFSASVSPGRTSLVVGGRVDATRHRVDLLAWASNTYADEVLPFDLTSNTFGPAVRAHDRKRTGSYTSLDVDESTGRVLVTDALWGDSCVVRATTLDVVDLDTATAAPAATVDRCVTGLASDQHGGSAYLPIGPVFSYPNLLPPAQFEAVSESDGHRISRYPVDGRSPFFPVVDSVHNVALVAFLATTDYYTNNNVMSAVGVVDLRTGTTTAVIPHFNLAGAAFQGLADFPQIERGLQVDPTTRTGYTFGPFGDELEQFRY